MGLGPEPGSGCSNSMFISLFIGLSQPKNIDSFMVVIDKQFFVLEGLTSDSQESRLKELS